MIHFFLRVFWTLKLALRAFLGGELGCGADLPGVRGELRPVLPGEPPAHGRAPPTPATHPRGAIGGEECSVQNALTRQSRSQTICVMTRNSLFGVKTLSGETSGPAINRAMGRRGPSRFRGPEAKRVRLRYQRRRKFVHTLPDEVLLPLRVRRGRLRRVRQC